MNDWTTPYVEKVREALSGAAEHEAHTALNFLAHAAASWRMEAESLEDEMSFRADRVWLTRDEARRIRDRLFADWTPQPATDRLGDTTPPHEELALLDERIGDK